MKSKKQMFRIVGCILAVLFTSILHAQNSDMPSDHVLILPGDIKWVKDANPAFLPGIKMAVLDGNPSSNGGQYTVRLMIPNGFKIMPHFHPADENITVLKGTFMMGMGDSFDEKALMSISENGYMSMKKGIHHYATAKGETIIQVNGVGPFLLTYVDPNDDPRNKK
jgi:hypothetical protein